MPSPESAEFRQSPSRLAGSGNFAPPPARQPAPPAGPEPRARRPRPRTRRRRRCLCFAARACGSPRVRFLLPFRNGLERQLGLATDVARPRE